MNREKDILKKWLDEAGHQAPSPGFSSRVLATIQAQEAKRAVFKPAVSPLRVKLAVAGIAAFFIGIILFVPNGNTQTGGASDYTLLVQNWLQNRASDASQLVLDGVSWPVLTPSDLSFNPLFGYALLAMALAILLKAYISTPFRTE